METEILRDLQARRSEIRSHWETLLRLERANSPLAQPDTLVHLLDTTLNEIFHDLGLWSRRHRPARAAAPDCPCRRNPLLAYFAAGRQALREALIQAQASRPPLTPGQRDMALACVDQIFSHISARDIKSFCALCQFRNPAPVPPAMLQVAQ